MYCMYTILNFNWKPSDFANLSLKEKAFVIACIDKRIEAEEKEKAKLRK